MKPHITIKRGVYHICESGIIGEREGLHVCNAVFERALSYRAVMAKYKQAIRNRDLNLINT